MPDAATFTIELEADLRDGFVAAAEASHRPAPQVLRELMREFVEREGHRAFVRRKVERARASARDGQGRSNQAVEADFAARRSRTAGGA